MSAAETASKLKHIWGMLSLQVAFCLTACMLAEESVD